MFSHAPEPVDQPQQANEERAIALYESALEPSRSMGSTDRIYSPLVAQAVYAERGKPYRPLH